MDTAETNPRETWVSIDGITWARVVIDAGAATQYYPWARYRWPDALWPYSYPGVTVIVKRFSPPEPALRSQDLRRRLAARLLGDGTTGQPGPCEEPTAS
jgi:hypothetical protein